MTTAERQPAAETTTNEALPSSGSQQSSIATARARYSLMRQALEATRPRVTPSDGEARVLSFLKSK